MTDAGPHPSSQAILSIVVVLFNMAREAPRTLLSLSPAYQGIKSDGYEVIVVENGSPVPLSRTDVEGIAPNFRYHYIPDAPKSPAFAINYGASKSSAPFLGIMIDGARIATPGVVRYALKALRAYDMPVVSTLGAHLGPDLQSRSLLKGYNEAVEDELLNSIGWPSDGYRLFEIASLADSWNCGWFGGGAESNGLFMCRKTFDALGGYDERFDLPGGGFVNLDFYRRACELPDSDLVILLGEATFHQVHSGTATSVPPEKLPAVLAQYDEQYFKIRKKHYSRPVKQADYLGQAAPQALEWIRRSAEARIALPAAAPGEQENG
ncbi:MAG: glycosyltransferase family 2 protein [Acidobacteria bacterium]|nr:glycosyltransferase family 2 protein [Acidobacteriota bacterium]